MNNWSLSILLIISNVQNIQLHWDMLCSSKAAESIQAEDESAKLCKRRIEHLKEHSSDQPASVNLWKKKRMDRMMVEHLLRCGYYNTAVKLARQSGIEVKIIFLQNSDSGNLCSQKKLN